jgi:lysophospholipase L1-like esterase
MMNIIFFGDSLTEGVPGASYYNILKEKIPEHNLVNCGKGGDTVISLYRRIKKMKISKTYDIAFIWIGTNDVLVNVSNKYPLLKKFLNQPCVKNIEEFRKYYLNIIEAVSANAKKIFTVSPLLIGEDMHNKWNEELGRLCEEIKDLSSEIKNAEYIDLRKDFISVLSSKKISSYILPGTIIDIVFSWLFNDPERVEKKSKERGLHLTLDGTHLNYAGAQMAADVFLKGIKAHEV